MNTIELIESFSDFKDLKNITICGVMGMATYTDDKNQIRKEFKKLKAIFQELKNEFFIEDANFKEISILEKENNYEKTTTNFTYSTHSSYHYLVVCDVNLG